MEDLIRRLIEHFSTWGRSIERTIHLTPHTTGHMAWVVRRRDLESGRWGLFYTSTLRPYHYDPLEWPSTADTWAEIDCGYLFRLSNQ